MFVVCHMIFLFLNFLFYLGQNSSCIFHECKPQTFPFLFHPQKQRRHRPVSQATTTKCCSFATIHVCFWFSLSRMTLSAPNSKAEQLSQDATGLLTFGMLFSVLFYICFQNASYEKEKSDTRGADWSLAKQMPYFSHKGGENPWILPGKGREGRSQHQNLCNCPRKENPAWSGALERRWCQRGARDTMGTANSSFPHPCNRQKAAGTQEGLVSVTLPCTPFNGELPQIQCLPPKGEQNPNILQKRKSIFCKEKQNESRHYLRKQIKGKNKIK